MKKKIYINAWGGLGDVVLATPLFQQLKLDFPDLKIMVLSPSRSRLDVLENNPYIDKLILFSFYYDLLKYFRIIKVNGISYGKFRPSYTSKKKAQEVIGEMFGVTLKDKSIKLYVTAEEDRYAKKVLSEYKNPVILQITSRTTNNQMWPDENWVELVRDMPDFTFIQLGTDNETKIEGAVDMRGKTNVRESIALVKHASSFVGVVSFLSHVTNAFRKPGVILFGGVSSHLVWGHDNNINITKLLTCSPCVDFMMGNKCPYDKPCMRMISVSEVQQAIYKQVPVEKESSLMDGRNEPVNR